MGQQEAFYITQACVDLLLNRIVVHFNVGDVYELAVHVSWCHMSKCSVEKNGVDDAFQHFTYLVLLYTLQGHEKIKIHCGGVAWSRANRALSLEKQLALNLKMACGPAVHPYGHCVTIKARRSLD